MYIIDSGRTGWVKIVYDRPEEKELPVQNGFAIAHLGADLKLFTRNRMNPSWDRSEFYYQGPDEKRVRLSSTDGDGRRVWAQEKTSDAEGERDGFFVGNQEEFSASLKTPKSIGGGLWQPSKAAEPATSADPAKILTELPK